MMMMMMMYDSERILAAESALDELAAIILELAELGIPASLTNASLERIRAGAPVRLETEALLAAASDETPAETLASRARAAAAAVRA